MMTSSTLPVMSVVEWDGVPIGDGRPGPLALALRKLLLSDAEPADDDQHDAVPYGYLTMMPQDDEDDEPRQADADL